MTASKYARVFCNSDPTLGDVLREHLRFGKRIPNARRRFEERIEECGGGHRRRELMELWPMGGNVKTKTVSREEISKIRLTSSSVDGRKGGSLCIPGGLPRAF